MTVADTPPLVHERAVISNYAQGIFWLRAIALLVDLVVIAGVDAAASYVFGVARAPNWTTTTFAGTITYGATYGIDSNQLLITWLVYFAVFEALFVATPGKWLLRLRVTDLNGRMPSLLAIAIRDVLRIVDNLPAIYVAGGLVALASPLRQRIGDQWGHTLVLPRSALAVPLLAGRQLRLRIVLFGLLLVGLLVFCSAFFYFGRPPLVIAGMVNAHQAPFTYGADRYTLSAPAWGTGTVAYHISYSYTVGIVGIPVQVCNATQTLRWQGIYGWQPGYAEVSCLPTR